MAEKLKKNFFTGKTAQTAEDLLGRILVRVLEDGQKLKGKIIETEAYLGIKDPSCHSFGGRFTPRTRVMFESGGLAYVYFTYGMHYCFNVVTAQKGQPEAVLIRALEPLEGITAMKKNRGADYNLTNGPARLCQAFRITKKLNGEDLTGPRLYIEKGEPVSKAQIAVSERIGLSPLSSSACWPLRFSLD